MNQSQFEAKTFGLGELITQRKLFRVPKHQRSYSWSSEDVASFIGDIQTAFESGVNQYFVGLVVIQGPNDGEWTLLDGQQRLTTATMIYAAIRDWLKLKGFSEDARQIEIEYIGVRRLGGDYSSRLILNQENADCFHQLVISDEENRKADFSYKSKSSNKMLSDCYFTCFKWIKKLVSNAGNISEGAKVLFKLSSFIESRVKTVCVEVSSEVDAYVLFESLNDRGTELSALDLIKNHVFSKLRNEDHSSYEKKWSLIAEKLEGLNPDDFLKVFWTSRFGLIQKDKIFRKMVERYSDAPGVVLLLEQLTEDLKVLQALEEFDSSLWSDYPQRVRDYLYFINVISAKQVRPVLLSAYRAFSQNDFSALLSDIITSVVRFQIIGRQRTGIVEKVFGRICSGIADGTICSNQEIRPIIKELYVEDDLFLDEFAAHDEVKLPRLHYLLSALYVYASNDGKGVRKVMEETRVHQIYPFPDILDDNDVHAAIGNYTLVSKEYEIDREKPELAYQITSQDVDITQSLGDISFEDQASKINDRARCMAKIAVCVWQLDFAS
jgi:hypothetical protein